MNNAITIETNVDADIDTVWHHWNNPESITRWAFASDDWECPHAENDLRVGGRFLSRMSAKDGSSSFDFSGAYTEVAPQERIAYVMDDGRKVNIVFEKISDTQTKIIETFEMENENSEELQRAGWNSILTNFKQFVETSH